MKILEEQIPDFIRSGRDREVVPMLYQKVFPLVQRFVLRNSGRKEDASDVFHDALLVFYKQVVKQTFDPKYKVYGYLYRLSINYWINKIKKESKIQLFETIPESYIEDHAPPSEIMVTGKDTNLLQEIFSGIGQKCIELLTYTTYQNLLMEDIMIRMGFTSLSAVKMQQQRCKKKLIEAMKKNPQLVNRLRKND